MKAKKAEKVAKPRIRKAQTMRSVLDYIDKFFVSEKAASTEKAKLWNVLSALRGPDEADIDKTHSTVPIRRAAFPRTAKGFNEGYAIRSMADFDPAPYLPPAKRGAIGMQDYGHFAAHILRAAAALGLGEKVEGF